LSFFSVSEEHSQLLRRLLPAEEDPHPLRRLLICSGGSSPVEEAP
jgi:hypothetical protein